MQLTSISKPSNSQEEIWHLTDFLQLLYIGILMGQIKVDIKKDEKLWRSFRDAVDELFQTLN